MSLDLSTVKVDPMWASKISAAVAIRRQVLPFLFMDGVLHLACANIHNKGAIRVVEQIVKVPIKTVEAEPKELREKIRQIYGDRSENNLSSTWSDSDQATDLSSSILNAAILRRASDIHVDPAKAYLRIFFRVDGHMELYRELQMSSYSSLVSRLKVLAGMDIAEKRSPQDGYISYDAAVTSRTVELRVATLPTKYGEKVTMRVMAGEGSSMTLQELGITGDNYNRLKEILAKPHGMILICGPTGSGKSTTLYAALQELITHELMNIITIEDPIEFELDTITQVEVNRPKLTFATALKSVLRHDPDVVMVGEMRDGETAEIAVKASMTGHLVLSTLHTNSAPGALTRLIDMGIERFLVGAVLELAVAQRLARKLCLKCRQEGTITTKEALLLRDQTLEGKKCFAAKGCMYCAGKGYSGRIGIFEMLFVEDDIARMITEGGSEDNIRLKMKDLGQTTLIEDGVTKVLNGDTSVDEILKIS